MLGISAHFLPFRFYLVRGNLDQRGGVLRSVRGIVVPWGGPLLYRVLFRSLRGNVGRLHVEIVEILDGYVLDDGGCWIVGHLLVISCPGKRLLLSWKHALNVEIILFQLTPRLFPLLSFHRFELFLTKPYLLFLQHRQLLLNFLDDKPPLPSPLILQILLRKLLLILKNVYFCQVNTIPIHRYNIPKNPVKSIPVFNSKTLKRQTFPITFPCL